MSLTKSDFPLKWRQSNWALLWRCWWRILGVVVTIAVAAVALFRTFQDSPASETLYTLQFTATQYFIVVAAGIPLAYQLIKLAWIVIQYKAWKNVATDKSVTSTYKFFKKMRKNFKYRRVVGVELEQSWLGRIFNYGDLKVELQGGGLGEGAVLANVPNPVPFEEYLKNLDEITDSDDDDDYDDDQEEVY